LVSKNVTSGSHWIHGCWRDPYFFLAIKFSKKWFMYVFQWTYMNLLCSEKMMDPVILVAWLAHHGPAIMSCNGTLCTGLGLSAYQCLLCWVYLKINCTWLHHKTLLHTTSYKPSSHNRDFRGDASKYDSVSSGPHPPPPKNILYLLLLLLKQKCGFLKFVHLLTYCWYQ